MPAVSPRLRPANPPATPPRPAPAMPKDLAALRDVLLAPEQALLDAIQHRLNDPATRAAELAEALPTALSLAAADPGRLTQVLRPLVREALAETLQDRPELLAAGCRHALRQSFRNPFRSVGRLFRRRRRGATVTARIEHLYLVRRDDGTLLAHVERPPAADEDQLDDGYQNDQRNIRSMATYLLATLRDPDLLTRYALLKTLRIERYVYGFHADERHLLLSVILAGAQIPADQLVTCDGILAGASHPEPGMPLLPPLA